MSATEWKPGDVALRTGRDGTTTLSMVVRTSRFADGDEPHWVHATGSWNTLDDGPEFGTYRRLVVLDPESDEDVKRLAEELYLHGMTCIGNGNDEYRAGMVDRVQAALRELASPTPPRIDEPGVWGVVEASCVHSDERRKWIRREDNNWWPAEEYGSAKGRADKGRDPRMPDDWDSLIAPVLVREGVPE